MTIDFVLWLLAIICFGIATFAGDPLGRVRLVPLGLALAALTFIVG